MVGGFIPREMRRLRESTIEIPYTLLMNFVYGFQEGMSIKIIIILSPSSTYVLLFVQTIRSTSSHDIECCVPVHYRQVKNIIFYYSEKAQGLDSDGAFRISNWNSQLQHWLFDTRSEAFCSLMHIELLAHRNPYVPMD